MLFAGEIDATDCDTTVDSIYSIIDPTGALGHQRAAESSHGKTKTLPAGEGDEHLSAEVQYGQYITRTANGLFSLSDCESEREIFL